MAIIRRQVDKTEERVVAPIPCKLVKLPRYIPQADSL